MLINQPEQSKLTDVVVGGEINLGEDLEMFCYGQQFIIIAKRCINTKILIAYLDASKALMAATLCMQLPLKLRLIFKCSDKMNIDKNNFLCYNVLKATNNA